jgi:hypothetical protein
MSDPFSWFTVRSRPQYYENLLISMIRHGRR